MSLVQTHLHNNTLTLTLLNEGKFNADLLGALNAALDQAEQNADVSGVIITGQEKVFSQGYDLEFMLGLGEQAAQFVNQSMQLLGRILSLGMPCVAAINGHAFGYGAMLAVACDLRLMRSDRGYFCLPEIDLKMNLHPVMNILLKQKLSVATLTQALLAGHRYGGSEAQSAGIVAHSCALTELADQAHSHIAAYLGKDRDTYAVLKQGLNSEILAVIEAQAA